MFIKLQGAFVKVLDDYDEIDAGDLAKALAMVVSAFIDSLPPEIRGAAASDFADELSKEEHHDRLHYTR